MPTLNEVLLPAMKEVGDKFGAGELILPFVLQSAEVMKRAVAQLEKYLDKIEGYTKGTVVLATVFGDVHDIGKSLVNTILTNNGYTVVDLGKQVPIQTILDAAAGARGDRDRPLRAARLHLQADARLHPGAARQGPRLPGADRRRGDQPRLRLPRAVPRRQRLRGGLRAGRLLLQGRLRGPGGDGPAVDDGRARGARGEAPRRGRARSARRARSRRRSSTSPTTPCARPRAPTCRSPTPPFWGVREIPVDLDEVYRHLDTHVLFKLHWGGRGVKGEAWQTLLREDFRPRLERMWREQELPAPARACSASSPATRWATTSSCSTPRTRQTELTRFVCPRQPKGDRICLADFFRPAVDGAPPAELDVIAVQAVTVGSEVTELMAKLESEGEFAEQLFVHGLGVQTAEGLAEWLHARAREMLGIDATQGRRYSWGYPAVPEQSEHLKVEKLLDLGQIGMSDHRRLRPRPRAVDARARRPPPAGDLLRHAPGPPARRTARPTTSSAAPAATPRCSATSTTPIRPMEPSKPRTSPRSPSVSSCSAPRRRESAPSGPSGDLLALVEVDRTPRIALEAGVEEVRGILQRGALGEGQLRDHLVGLAVQMIPPGDHTGTPLHFQSSRTSGSACLISARTRASVSPRQSPSSAIRSAIS